MDNAFQAGFSPLTRLRPALRTPAVSNLPRKSAFVIRGETPRMTAGFRDCDSPQKFI
jgi:hypothetical protein